MRKILIGLVIFSVVITTASAGQNSIVDNMKLALGLDQNDFKISNQSNNKFGDKFNVSSKYDATYEWFIDGKLTKKDKDVRESIYIPAIQDIPKQNKFNKVGYKAGINPVTKKMRYILELKYNGDVKRWIIEN